MTACALPPRPPPRGRTTPRARGRRRAASRAWCRARRIDVTHVAFERRLHQRRAHAFDGVLRDVERHEVGIGEVAIVVRLFFGALAVRHACTLVPAARLLNHAAAAFDDANLPRDLRLGRAPQAAERVDVLDLGFRAVLARAAQADRHVGVAAQRAFLHLDVAHAELAERARERLHERDRFFRAAQVRLADALHQRHARAVEIDQRRRRAREPAVRARVRRLARVLFDVDARQPALAARAVVEPVAHHAALRERHVVLRDLVILGHVGIEIVLAVELRVRGDLRAEREPRANHVLERLRVGHGQRARQRETHRAHVRVRLAAERVGATAEHLRLGLELDMALDPDNRFVLVEQLGRDFGRDLGRRHRGAPFDKLRRDIKAHVAVRAYCHAHLSSIPRSWRTLVHVMLSLSKHPLLPTFGVSFSRAAWRVRRRARCRAARVR